MSKTILMIAFEFPPSNGASVQRTLKFFEYLNELGWNTVMLTADVNAYSNVDENFHVPLNENQFVYRAKAYDVHKDLSYKGKHFNWMKTPDRWGTWIPFAIKKGKKIIDKHQPDVIWSTFPTPSVNIIANSLRKYANVPWVADYRDPAPYIHTTNGKWLDWVHKKIDNLTFKNAHLLTFATEESKNLYKKHYPNTERFHVIENGYDEENFKKAEALAPSIENIFSEKKHSMYYAGGLYPNGRDPVPIFEALSNLKKQKVLSEDTFELIFQGAGNGEEFKEDLARLGIENMVTFLPPVPFIQALVNMMRTDSLLLIQDERFNLQIPGKIFEYFRTGKPILIKTPQDSATAKIAQKNGHNTCTYLTIEVEALVTQMLDNKLPMNIQGSDIHSRRQKAVYLDKILATF